MTPQTQQTAKDFVKTHGVQARGERVPENPHMEGSSSTMDNWRVTLSMGRKRMSVFFSKGFGHQGKEPTAAEVLDTLAMDAGVRDVSFEEWARELGYGSDSRKAQKTFQVTAKQTARLRAFLGEELFEELLEAERL